MRFKWSWYPGLRPLLGVVAWVIMGACFPVLAQQTPPAPVAEGASPPAIQASSTQATALVQDPVLEAQVMAIAHELRCLVCQNETVAASQADLAQDLRKQIRVQIKQGRTPAQIMDFMVARYGEFVRYRPALTTNTLMLWVGPFVLLLLAFLALGYVVWRRRNQPPAVLSPSQKMQAQALLNPLTGPPPP